MNDTSKSAAANPGTSEPEHKPAADPVREPIPRRLYVAMRLEEISALVGAMAKEREQATADLKAPPAAEGPNHKQLRQRRAYLAQRLAISERSRRTYPLKRRPWAPPVGKATTPKRTQSPHDSKTSRLLMAKKPTACTAVTRCVVASVASTWRMIGRTFAAKASPSVHWVAAPVAPASASADTRREHMKFAQAPFCGKAARRSQRDF